MGRAESTSETATVAAARSVDSSTPTFGWLAFGDGSMWAVRRNVVLGRAPFLGVDEVGCTDVVAFDDPTMSRRHLMFVVDGTEPPRFVDLSSRSGSWIVSEPEIEQRHGWTSADGGVELGFGMTSVRWLASSDPAPCLADRPGGSTGSRPGDFRPQPGRTAALSVLMPSSIKDPEPR